MDELIQALGDMKELEKVLMHKIIPNLIGTALILFIGIWFTRFIRKVVKKMMVRRDVDITVQTFVNQLLKWILYIVLFLTIIQKLGIPASSFLGALTASAVAIGLALQGSLSNFAGGLMLLILKPFRIGDTIEAKGERGQVQKIGMFYTTLTKFGNEVATIPNGPLFADSIVNYTTQERRRAKIIVGISYNSEIKKAREIMLSVAEKCPLALPDPAPIVFVEELADSSVNMSLRVWALTPNYVEMYHSLLENIKLEFDKENIEIPFPQRDVHLITK